MHLNKINQIIGKNNLSDSISSAISILFKLSDLFNS